MYALWEVHVGLSSWNQPSQRNHAHQKEYPEIQTRQFVICDEISSIFYITIYNRTFVYFLLSGYNRRHLDFRTFKNRQKPDSA